MKYLAPACVILLAGCQHLSYHPPSGDNTAELTFTSNNTAAQPVVCVPGEGFESTEYALAQQPLGGDALNDLLETMKKSPEVTTTIAASSQSRIGVSYNQRKANGQRDRCKVAVQFESQAGQAYTAHFIYDNDQCGLSLSHADGSPVDAVRTDWQCP
ncbi:MAG: hypothetical protein MI745_13770 [Pseudomonadales bacterium]|nr:hypothetical protein [Pseudomonadales bacterium]